MTLECPMEVFHQKMEKLIYQVVWKFKKKHQLTDYDEILSQAQWSFVKYCKPEWNSTMVYKRLWWDLLNWLETHNQKPISLDQEEIDIPDNRQFNVKKLLAEVSNDAAVVIKLAVCPEVHQEAKNDRPGSIREKLVEILGELGWGVKEILKAFYEVRQAL